ncbi:MAG: nicotinamide riboside transporter PnuC [Bacteroidia bacterium]|nr:nicotinamide riboside transporter PnuC [Bacteroidia bacterium]NND25253.1 nicotinamide mononucleotide transporter [Flavobacteriaceae bacterium]NNL32805.1 nicotinamide mononucleotide transporter [Flavobacteriaceae bacterium]
MEQLTDFFLQPYRSASSFDIALEVTAALFGIASVWFAKKESIWVYPAGIISTAIYVYICFMYTLYGDLIINVYYTGMSIYGWYMWTHIIEGEHIEITTSSPSDSFKALVIFAVTAAFVICVYLYFDRFDRLTDYFDTFTTGIFFAAMWLMANKKIEHWTLWIVGNIISIPLYFIKGLGFTGIQFMIFLILAILGYNEWKRSLDNNPQRA